ncbi:MAG TPA: rhodanese-like domain-containing protein, partial [Methanoregula sp.]|nr:rhodanese-like domain-containing protein [Methanoregula sp.]
MNSRGAPSPYRLPQAGPLSVPDIGRLRKTGCQVIDIRSPAAFAGGHIPGSLSIWRDGLASFMGWFLNYEDPVVIVDDFNLDMADVCVRFIRLGYDNLAGWLAGGFISWVKAAQDIASFSTCSPADLHARM